MSCAEAQPPYIIETSENAMTHPIFAIGLPHGAEWLYLLVIILLLFGGAKLPQLARGLGKSLGEFKKAKEEFEKEVHSAAIADENKPLEDKNRGVTPNPGATPLNSVPTTGDESAKKI
jgi:TatA/E family protein of Tat protein translocase